MGADSSNNLAAQKGHVLQIMHIPTGRIVEFKAFVTDFSDNYNSSWQKTPVYGRMDDIATFQGTTRQISVTWDVPAFSNEEAKLNLQKASLLFSMLYPTYEPSPNMGGAGQMSAAPLLKMKFANLICNMAGGNSNGGVESSGLVGFIEGSAIMNPNFERGFHDPGFGELYPMAYSLSLTFNVLHTHKLGWESGAGRGNSRLNSSADASTSQFPYGSSYPPKSSNVVNNLGESDAADGAESDAQDATNETTAGAPAPGDVPVDEDAIRRPQDAASGFTDEFGRCIPAGQAGSPAAASDAIKQAQQATVLGGVTPTGVGPTGQANTSGNPPTPGATG